MLASEALDERRPLFGPGTTPQTSLGEQCGSQVSGIDIVELGQDGERQSFPIQLPPAWRRRVWARRLGHQVCPAPWGNGRKRRLQGILTLLGRGICLDERPACTRQVLEGLRQPIEK
jgi:hypothetical protein